MADGIWGASDPDVNGVAPSGSSGAWGLSDADVASAKPATAAPEPQLLPIAPYGTQDAVLHGMTLGLSDVADAAGTALGRYFRGDTPGFDYSQAAREIERGREAYAGSSPFANAAENVIGAVGGPAGAASTAIKAATPLGKLAIGALSGGAIGGVQGAADNSSSPAGALAGAENGAGVGAAVGGALPMAAEIGGRLLPTISPAAQTLRAAGVEPTPGAAVGGLPGALESVMSRIPLIGAPMDAGRQAALDQFGAAVKKNADDFNRSTVNYALDPIGESLGPSTATGNDAIAEMAQKVGAAYDKAVPAAGAILDPQASQDLARSIANAKFGMPPDRAQQFENFVQAKITGRLQGGGLTGQAFKDAESDLGREASSYSGQNSTADERKLGDTYRQLQGTLRGWLARVNPQSAGDLQAANQAYSRMLRVQDAASRASDGVFSPENLLAASKKFGGNVQYSRGGALMQDVAQNALLQKQALAGAGRSLATPVWGNDHGASVSAGMIGADVLEHMTEHPSLATLGAMALTYPALHGLYSNAGRGAVNNLLGTLARSPSIAPFAPIGADLAAH